MNRQEGNPHAVEVKEQPPRAPVGVEGLMAIYDAAYMKCDDDPDDRIAPKWRGIEAVVAALTQQPAAIPRLANCGKYTATDNNGQHYYLNHANTWQTFQGQQPTAVDEAMVHRALAAYEEVRWAGRSESPPPPRHVEAMRAALTAALAAQPGGSDNDRRR